MEYARVDVLGPKNKGLVLTCVVEEGSDEGAVLEEGVGGGDVLEVTLFKKGVLEYHGLHLEIQKPMIKPEDCLSAPENSLDFSNMYESLLNATIM